MSHVPIRAAYEANGALDRDCPMCQASPGQWCADPRGRLRRVPCVSRTANNFPGAGKVIESAASHGRDVHDFSEPRHPPAAMKSRPP